MEWGEMVDRESFAAVLREYRARAGVSQEKLSELAGMSHSYVSRLESGERGATKATVKRLAAALGLTVGETDRMLIRLGMMPDDPASMLEDEPVLVAAAGVLRDADEAVAGRLRVAIGNAIDQAIAADREAAGVGG